MIPTADFHRGLLSRIQMCLGEAHTLPTLNVEPSCPQPSTQLLFGLANDALRASAAPERRGFPSISLGTTIANGRVGTAMPRGETMFWTA